jgi:GTP pyrophosphokinase
MVQVRDAYPLDEAGEVDISRWIVRLPIRENAKISTDQLLKAAELARRFENTEEEAMMHWGEGYSRFLTGLEMVEILTDLNLDENTLVAAMLYRCVREGALALDEVKEVFGEAVPHLIQGVLRMADISGSKAAISSTKVLGQKSAQSDHARKMLVAMVDDVRMALIKLAERTCAIRAVKNKKSRRQKVALEIFQIYAPLAHRLGIGHIKWELEDLSFRYIDPDAYKRIATLLDERRLDRQQFINEVTAQLNHELAQVSIEGDVFGRAKHIYSIWRKMQRKRIDFSEVYDIRAVRILVNDIRDCYSVLGIVHTLWKAIPNEFDDYIALPKENGYRSLHTAVFGPGGKILEVQIRTHEMHQEAEFGVCAHWQYKGADGASGSKRDYEEKIAWLKRVIDESEDAESLSHIAAEWGTELESSQIYAFTPKGHVIEMQAGATPLDFAYRVHTEIGHRCRGAKVNGRIVPLTYPLENGQQVEIITGTEAEPNREWLRPTLGYLKTNRARAKVRYWFKLRDRDQNIATGRTLLEREFKRLSLSGFDYKAISEKLGFEMVDDMFASVGSGDMGTGAILRAAKSLFGRDLEPELAFAPKSTPESGKVGEVYIDGTGNMLTTMAACCKPLPGDRIGGYVTVGRGVTIHRLDCNQYLTLQKQESERIIEVSWGNRPQQSYPVDIQVEAYDRSGLLRDISLLLANEKTNVLSVQTLTNPSSNVADMQLTLEVAGIEGLSKILAKIDQLPNVIRAYRLAH